MVSESAESTYQNLYLEIDIPAGAKYIYTYVANESIGTNVFFDDFTVTQLGVDITETTDYYPFGSIASHWQKEDYRFGYQGEFAEEDKETGFNHFEARAFDTRIGRWMSRDPSRQFFSPYNGMGNNPISGIDPDGRFKKEWQSKLVAFLTGGTSELAIGGDRAGEYFVGKEIAYGGEGAGVSYQRTFDIEADINASGAFTIGVQAGSFLTGLEGIDINIASFSLLAYEFKGSLSFNDGFSVKKNKLTPVWEDSQIKSKIGGDIPFLGASLEQTFWYSNPDQLKRQFEVHGGLPAVGLKNTYDLLSPTKKTTLSGSAGAKLIVGGEAGYDIGLKRVK